MNETPQKRISKMWQAIGVGGVIALCGVAVAIFALAYQIKSGNDQFEGQATEIAHAQEQSYMLGTIAAAQPTYEIPFQGDTPSPQPITITEPESFPDDGNSVTDNKPPAASPTQALVPTPLEIPTTEPTAAVTLRATPTTDVISIWGIDEIGAKISVNKSCVYTIEYVGDAYSPWPFEEYTGYLGWTTIARIYINRPVDWGVTEYGLIGPINFDHYIGPGGYNLDKQQAVTSSIGDSRTIRLNDGDYITVILIDERGQYEDNRGKIDLGITCIAPL